MAEAGPTQTSIDRWSQQIFERQRPTHSGRSIRSQLKGSFQG
jgi:hypothetical protein